ncbi:MAG: NAD+ synthase [Spirochaetales bacterium]|jgi:NAD+ synthase (glutamine-hydrolysing)|nr:NAD+ synthase [Spirochaetales bacterium]
MKIALIQLNPTIGDFTHNGLAIKEWADKAIALGAEFLVFPELALCGYPPQDYLEHPDFIRAQNRLLHELIDSIQDIPVLLGAFTENHSLQGKKLFNAGILFHQGKIIFTSHKKLLPTYDVFDEQRYFEPGTTSQLVQLNGKNIGITICEDIFNDPDIYPEQLYKTDPIALLHDEDELDFIINIAASPYIQGKDKARIRDFSIICQKYQTPLLYCNQVGGQDSLLFDGGSFVLDQTGTLCGQAASFTESILLVDTDNLIQHETTQPADIQQVYNGLVMGTRDYIRKCGFSKAIVGLSGGIDSALTCAIGCDALGAENVMGITLPSPHSSQGSIADSLTLAQNLGITCHTLPINDIFSAFKTGLAPFFAGRQEDVTEQNLQARSRGVLLMALANKFGALLLTTGNKSELAVGYCTLYGDMSGALAVIADVPKLLAYELARYINRSQEIIPVNTITKPPSAELAPDQTDQDDLPPYEILDPILAAYLEDHLPLAEIVHQGFPETVVKDIVRRIKINEYKRKQGALGLKVTSKAFGFGRRYPNAQGFTG